MIHVVWDEEECRDLWRQGSDCYAGYAFEMLDYLGLAFDKYDTASWIREQPQGLTIVIGAADGNRWRTSCADYCRDGNSLLAIGGTFGLGETLGVAVSGSIREGWVDWADSHWAKELRGSFHFFGASVASIATDVCCEGKLIRRGGTALTVPALTTRHLDKGIAAWLNVDLMRTFVQIQQGISVVRDGLPAPDGSAGIDDELLKTDDAAVLDWKRDREALSEGEVPFYLHPIVDEWRILFMRILHDLLERSGTRYGQVWFWPNGQDGIGHISHDSDGNSSAHAERTLVRLKEAGIVSTWCILIPGYDRETSRRIVDAGHEIALHFNAMGTDIEESDWRETHFRLQLAMLKEHIPGKPIVSNKNHYLRWEGDVQFYRWCERAGIVIEQSRGGTKQGNKGFLAGTCHPYRPIDHAGEYNRLMYLISLPTLAWDPPLAFRCTRGEAMALLNRALDVYGVAHFLFHPGLLDPEGEADAVGEMLTALVQAGRDRGIEWWTSETIGNWLRDRRGIKVEALERLPGEQTLRATVVSDVRLERVSLLLTASQEEGAIVQSANEAAFVHDYRPVMRFGVPYMELIADLPAGRTQFMIRTS